MNRGDDLQHQREHLLCEYMDENSDTCDTWYDESPRAINGAGQTLRIEMPIVERMQPTFPKERWKTCVALVFVVFNFVATTTSLSITHELRQTTADPLPDISLDNLPYFPWALDVSEVLIMVSTALTGIVIIFHKHRLILIRRVCVIVGLLYGYRAITMIVTVLPAANKLYKCAPKLNHTITSIEVLHRVVKIISGFGLSINGQHIYCGDFIFSGHTMILVLSYLILSEYTPRRLYPLHFAAWIISAAGVVMLMMARGHYSIDIVVAYFITTRLWFVYNSIILNPSFQVKSATNHLGRLWWWRLAVWFEERVPGPVPLQYEWPLPGIPCIRQNKKKMVRNPGRNVVGVINELVNVKTTKC